MGIVIDGVLLFFGSFGKYVVWEPSKNEVRK